MFHSESSVEAGLIPELIEKVGSVGGNVHFVELRCAETTILERIENGSRKDFGKLVDGALYREISAAGGFDFPPLPTPLLVIESDAVEAEVSAQRIFETLQGVA